MTKSWFVLQNTSYPPPDTSYPLPDLDKMANDGYPGPILLGHIITDLKRPDPLNLDDIVPFPPDMPILTSLEHFGTLRIEHSAGLGFTDLPSGCLETQIIQPTEHYVARCVASSSVVAYIKKSKTLGALSLYMITGLKIMRRASVDIKAIPESEL
jgi:hypothetical protein